MTKSEPKFGEWVPVSEGLPEYNADVLISHADGSRMVAWRSGARGNWTSGHYDFRCDEVLAWMPLPPPYVPDGNEKKEGGE